MKMCKRCKIEKDVSEFYIHRRMYDGLLSFCKPCTKKRVSKHRDNNMKRIRSYDRFRRKPENMTKKQIEQKKKYEKEYRQKHKKESNARNHVHRKLKNKRPEICSNCGLQTKIVGHHFDYNKPIDVVWLCQSCHVRLHRGLKPCGKQY